MTLTDGIADLIADMEHDLRDRLRKVQREAENSIDEGDPGPIWDQITEWLDQRVAAAVSETFVWTDERSRWLSEEVAELFSDGESGAPGHRRRRHPGRARPGRADGRARLRAPRRGGEDLHRRARIVRRRAHGRPRHGTDRPVADQPALAPGRRAGRPPRVPRRHERAAERAASTRRSSSCAATSTRSSSRSASSSRTACAWCSASARDHFGSMAEELHRSLSDALSAAKQAAGTYTSKRDERVTQLQAQLEQLETLRTGDRPRCRRCATEAAAAVTASAKEDAEALLRTAADVYDDDPEAADGDRRTRAAPARAAAAGDRRHGQGRQVDAAERHARRADRADRRRRSARGWSRGTATPRRRRSRCIRATANRDGCRCAASRGGW